MVWCSRTLTGGAVQVGARAYSVCPDGMLDPQPDAAGVQILRQIPAAFEQRVLPDGVSAPAAAEPVADAAVIRQALADLTTERDALAAELQECRGQIADLRASLASATVLEDKADKRRGKKPSALDDIA